MHLTRENSDPCMDTHQSDRKRVCFSVVDHVYEVERWPEEVKEAYWYQSNDYTAFKQDREECAHAFLQQRESSTEHCIRGIEVKVDPTIKRERYARLCAVWDSVLAEQDMQAEDHFFCVDSIRAASIRWSRNSTHTAAKVALIDAEEAGIVSEPPEIIQRPTPTKYQSGGFVAFHKKMANFATTATHLL